MITRRTTLAGLALLSLSPAARAEPGNDALTRYPAEVSGKRPAVILLHGSRGIEIRPRAYQRYADALSAKGIDAYLLRYMTETDMATLNSKMSTKESREAYDTTRFDGWSDTVAATVTSILGRPDSSGRVGLLGFSLGGFIAANTAARDARIAALAVLYGGMPNATASKVKHMPPMIELHGEADQNVSIANGKKLIALAKSVGAEAEFVPYPGKPHGFDFSDSDPMTADAIDRVSRFFAARLAG
ncbi:dienelactone hydrolase family protein [Bradyrhizobium sp. CCGUVB1N3]|uniref:dienelactone hydrolase family protein n=1 Tax=Bradyrhizobium sp. CCGUVB1N3 TaxID=2949629 RepID=UPI0020B1F690|nr:dienelactone hydrolase family protein [Bradyrhizobium sp. CCGUVB1N3]MCP3477567.1 dienelactone hydrolase family protein [Bradyrhizobium sp. CCGUVB1N3]